MEKICMTCSLLKPIRKETDSIKNRNKNQIHEYNYSCYKCLDDLKQKDITFLYKQLENMGYLYSA